MLLVRIVNGVVLRCGVLDEGIGSIVQCGHLGGRHLIVRIELNMAGVGILSARLGIDRLVVELPVIELLPEQHRPRDSINLGVRPVGILRVVSRPAIRIDVVDLVVAIFARQLIVHRTRSVEHQNDIERLARRGGGIGGRGQSRERYEEIGIADIDARGSAIGRCRQLHARGRYCLVRPDAADVLGVVLNNVRPRCNGAGINRLLLIKRIRGLGVAHAQQLHNGSTNTIKWISGGLRHRHAKRKDHAQQRERKYPR